jgi:hypothetical protein
MKISRMANEKLAPEWVFNNSEHLEDLSLILEKDLDNFDAKSERLTEDDIVLERERVETCASGDSVYFCSSAWGKEATNSLKEYAIVCGLKEDRFKVVEPQQVEDLKITMAAANRPIELEIKKAEFDMKEEKNGVEAIGLFVKDPFKLDIKEAEAAEDWQAVRGQKILGKPAMDFIGGGVKSIAGGEDYFTNSNINPAANQNSITNPGAIQALAESEKEDTGARLKRENEEKVAQREVEHKAWQQEKVAAMPELEIIPKGKVFPTEAMNAQPGIFHAIEMPEKTLGERVAEKNQDHRREIQGADKEVYEFMPSKASTRSISDTFADELTKHLK